MKNNQFVQCLMMGFLLLVAGWIIIFTMVIRMTNPSFFLSFLGYGLSLAGLLCGVVGIVLHRK